VKRKRKKRSNWDKERRRVGGGLGEREKWRGKVCVCALSPCLDYLFILESISPFLRFWDRSFFGRGAF
jgi:hypothetical protein